MTKCFYFFILKTTARCLLAYFLDHNPGLSFSHLFPLQKWKGKENIFLVKYLKYLLKWCYFVYTSDGDLLNSVLLI